MIKKCKKCAGNVTIAPASSLAQNTQAFNAILQGRGSWCERYIQCTVWCPLWIQTHSQQSVLPSRPPYLITLVFVDYGDSGRKPWQFSLVAGPDCSRIFICIADYGTFICCCAQWCDTWDATRSSLVISLDSQILRRQHSERMLQKFGFEHVKAFNTCEPNATTVNTLREQVTAKLRVAQMNTSYCKKKMSVIATHFKMPVFTIIGI